MVTQSVKLDQLKRILTFNQVGLKIQEEQNIENIYRIIGEGLKEIGLNCVIMLLDEKQKCLYSGYISALPSVVAKGEKLLGIKDGGLKVPVESAAPVARAMRERRAVFTTRAVNMINELNPSLRHAPMIGRVAKMMGVGHAICAPLIARGNVFGSLAVWSRNIPEEEIPIVVAFANQAAIAIDNAGRLPLEFKAKARELEKSEEKYRQLLENMKDGYAVTQYGKVIFANRRLDEIFGYKSGQMIGLSVTEFIAPEEIQDIMEIYMKVVRGEEKEPDRLELMALKKSGTTFPIQCGVSTIEYEGKPAFSIIIRDFTEQKQAENNYRQLLEDIHDGYAVMLEDGEVIYANERFGEIFGYEPGQVIGYVFPQFIAPSNLLSVLDLYSRVTSGKEKVPKQLEITGIKRDGSIIPIESTVKAIQYQGNHAFSVIVRDITERKQAEESLRRSEEHFRLLIENIYDVIMVLGADGTILYTSPSIERVLGYKRKELAGKQGFEFFRLDDIQPLLDAFSKVIQKPGHIESVVARVCHKDGTWLDVEGTGVSLLNEPSVAGVVISFRDITERKRVEEALIESQEMYRSMVETADKAGEGIMIAQNTENVEGAVVFVNDEVLRITGYTRDEFIGSTVRDLLPPDDLLELMDRYKRRQAGEDLPGYQELWLNRKDGTTVPVEVCAGVLTYRGKVSTMAFIRDITKNKQAEERLQRSEEYFRLLTENSYDVIVILSADGIISYTSPSATRVIGYEPEEVIGKQAYNFVHPEDLPPFLSALSRTIKTPGYSESLEARLHHKDGSWRYVEGTGISLLAEPSVAGIVINYHDITERKQAEEQLKEYSENLEQIVEDRTLQLEDTTKALIRTEKLAVIGELAGSMAHELRNPLAAVKASTHFVKMKMRGTDDEKLIKHLNILEKQADLCNSIITDLLNFSRPAKFEMVAVDLDQLVREVVQNTRIPRNIDVSTSLMEDIAPVMADRRHLERVFSNLVNNSIESMPNGGKLSVSTNQKGLFVEVRVADTGMGIPEENLDQIFEPLFTTKTKGVGLGLSLAKALVEKQEGIIDVQSQVDKGTTFIVKFPITGSR